MGKKVYLVKKAVKKIRRGCLEELSYKNYTVGSVQTRNKKWFNIQISILILNLRDKSKSGLKVR